MFHIRLVQSTMSQRINGRDYSQEAGMVIHATMNKMARITDTVFIGHVHQLSINNTDQDRYRIICLARKTPCRIYD